MNAILATCRSPDRAGRHLFLARPKLGLSRDMLVRLQAVGGEAAIDLSRISLARTLLPVDDLDITAARSVRSSR